MAIIQKKYKDRVYDYNTETKLYLNPETNKWIKRPRHQRGKFIGLNTGKAIGKTVGKTVGKRYENKLNWLKTNYSWLPIKCTLYIPSQISDEFLQSIIDDCSEPLNLATMKLVLSTLFLKDNQFRQKYHNKRINMENEKDRAIGIKLKYHWVEITAKEWEKILYCGKRYSHYLVALEQAGIIECDHEYYNFETISKARYYKLSDKFYEHDRTIRYYRIELLTDPKLLFKITKSKAFYIEHSIFNNPKRFDTFNMFNSIDPNFLDKYINGDELMLFEFYDLDDEDYLTNHYELQKIQEEDKKMTPHELKNQIIHIQEGNFYFNDEDNFGKRFHTPFTNLPKIIRPQVKYADGNYACEFDIRNSQMGFLSLLFEYSNEAKKILIDETHIHNSIDKLKEYSERYDVTDFVESSLRGKLYEKYEIMFGCPRNFIKQDMFNFMFSKSHHFQNKKEDYSDKIPSILYICNQLNDEGNYVPMMCQLFESEVMIRHLYDIVKDGKLAKYEITTVHDSVICHISDIILLIKIYKDIFRAYDMDYLPIKINRNGN